MNVHYLLYKKTLTKYFGVSILIITYHSEKLKKICKKIFFISLNYATIAFKEIQLKLQNIYIFIAIEWTILYEIKNIKSLAAFKPNRFF